MTCFVFVHNYFSNPIVERHEVPRQDVWGRGLLLYPTLLIEPRRCETQIAYRRHNLRYLRPCITREKNIS